MHDALEESDVAARRHWLVAVAAHADRDDALVRSHVANAVRPERAQRRIVALIVPFAFAIALPFLLRAHHRLVVRRAHHDPVVVGQLRVGFVVVVERVAPHRGPEIVALETQDQLEHLRVELVVDAAELFLGPAGERGRFVVEEDPAVLHRRLAIAVGTRQHVQRRLVAHRNVGPPRPRRHSDRRRHVVQPIDRPALVASRDDQSVIDPLGRVFDNLNEECLPPPRHVRDVQRAVVHESVDERIVPQRSGHDHGARLWRNHRIDRDDGRPGAAGDATQVGRQVLRRALHSDEIGRTHNEPSRVACGDERESSRPLRRRYI